MNVEKTQAKSPEHNSRVKEWSTMTSPSPPSIHLLRHFVRSFQCRHTLRSTTTRRRLERQRRSVATKPLCAQPSQFVAGVTMDRLESSPSMREWYEANYPSWKDDPEKFVVTEDDTADDVHADGANDGEPIHDQDGAHAILLPPHLASRNIRPIVAYLRDPHSEEGTRSCHRLRTSNPLFPLIPGILHGSDPTATPRILSCEPSSKIMVKTPWFEIQRELDRYHHAFTSRVYALTLFSSEDARPEHHKSRQTLPNAGASRLDEPPLPSRTPLLEHALVLPADLQLHPVQHRAYCLNFVRYHPAKPVSVPIVPVNEEESPAMKRGGFIAFVHKTIECLVEEGARIPDSVGLECAGLRAKEVVRRERLVLPEGVTIHPRVGEDFLVGTVFGVKGGGEEEGEGEKKADGKKK